ncbi:MAG: phosphate ABC transporter permease subunit PstC [Candidatus Korarchaeota archaeon]|nr:phosphate ABC transporter permease subunit PstC [Candidatus Korarchaeota archaeon]
MDRGFFLSLLPFASIIFALFALLAYVLISESWPAFDRFGIGLLVENVWKPSEESVELVKYGLLAPLYGTLVTSVIAVTVALPLSTATVFFMEELAPRRVKEIFSSIIDLMAGLPTIIYGLWGLEVMVPLLRESMMVPLYTSLGFLPPFSCDPLSGASFLSAGLLLAIMIIPFMHGVIKEAYRQVPRTYKEAALTLGATRYEYFRIMMSLIRPAVVAAVLLGLGRAASETVAVALVVGNAFNVSPCLFAPGYTISSLIANQFAEASFFPLMENVMFAGSLVLLALGMVFSGVGVVMMRKVRSLYA